MLHELADLAQPGVVPHVGELHVGDERGDGAENRRVDRHAKQPVVRHKYKLIYIYMEERELRFG